jgi:hypothetical protein
MADGRTTNGGARRGAGQKPKAFLKERQRFLQKNVTQSELKKIVDVALAQAQAGNTDARKFIFDGYFGPETQQIDIGLAQEVADLISEVAGLITATTEADKG